MLIGRPNVTAAETRLSASAMSLAALRSIWQKYFVYVHAPQFGMVDHTVVFWIISAKGTEEYLTNPGGGTQFVGGTSQLVATYVAKVLNSSFLLAQHHRRIFVSSFENP